MSQNPLKSIEKHTKSNVIRLITISMFPADLDDVRLWFCTHYSMNDDTIEDNIDDDITAQTPDRVAGETSLKTESTIDREPKFQLPVVFTPSGTSKCQAIRTTTRTILDILQREGQVRMSDWESIGKDQRRIYDIFNILEWTGLVRREKQSTGSKGRGQTVFTLIGGKQSSPVDILHLKDDIESLRQDVARLESAQLQMDDLPSPTPRIDE
jgi:predicted transcriptional regulator